MRSLTRKTRSTECGCIRSHTHNKWLQLSHLQRPGDALALNRVEPRISHGTVDKSLHLLGFLFGTMEMSNIQ